jgi:hypothetical protein
VENDKLLKLITYWEGEILNWLVDLLSNYLYLQINSVTKVNDRSVSAEVNILVNVTDNEARYKCEASNSATEIPLFETVTLNVYCKYEGCA